MTAAFQRDTKPADWSRRVSALRAQPCSWRQRSELGNLLRVDPRRIDESISLQREALRLARRECSARPAAVAHIRLAIAIQYAGRHAEALRHFAAADRTVREVRLRGLRDFVEQHRGKCLAEMGRIDEARVALRAALRLRTRRRRPSRELVASTRRALAKLEW